MAKKEKKILLQIIWALVIIIIAGIAYMIIENNKSKNTNLVDTPLVIEAEKIGLDKGELKKCISENKFLDKINSQMKTGADNFGITGTPGNVLINNETGKYIVISGAYPKEAFISAIDNLITKKQAPKKDFNKNIDNNTVILISDIRDNSPIDQLIGQLKNLDGVSNMKFETYDYSNKGVKEFLEENNITKLPVILFPKNKIDTNIDSYLTKLENNDLYSLNIGAQFDPKEYKAKIINKEILNKIKENSYINGKKDAKITWLEYSDLECPYCQKLHNSDVESTLKEKYGDDLNIIFNHFPLGFHKKAIPGANILECVGEQGGDEAFYEILKYAYKNRIQE